MTDELSSAPVPPAIACTLDADAMPERLADWQSVLAHVVHRTDDTSAVHLEFDDAVDVADLARLVVAEQRCCAFFSFAITVDARGIGLDVAAPDDAAELVRALFGSAG